MFMRASPLTASKLIGDDPVSKIAFYGDEKPLLKIIQEAVSPADLQDKKTTSLDEAPDDYHSMGM